MELIKSSKLYKQLSSCKKDKKKIFAYLSKSCLKKTFAITLYRRIKYQYLGDIA
jgi:hypothetical protein